MIDDFKQLSEERLESLLQTAKDGRLIHALQAAWKVKRMACHLAAQKRQGLNQFALDRLEREYVSLDHLADYAMNAYRHSVECLPYTYDENHRPFEYEGYTPDFNYAQIAAAYSALYHAADRQADEVFKRIHQTWIAADGRLKWDDLWQTPDGIEYRAIKDSAHEWYKLMGHPGYWHNWQLPTRRNQE